MPHIKSRLAMNCQASAQVLCSITNLAIVFRLNRFHNFNGLHFMDFLGWGRVFSILHSWWQLYNVCTLLFAGQILKNSYSKLEVSRFEVNFAWFVSILRV